MALDGRHVLRRFLVLREAVSEAVALVDQFFGIGTGCYQIGPEAQSRGIGFAVCCRGADA